jgi:ligand-binding sensor domain-containing protein/Cdc6-like AAA superfamily ATPase
MLLLSLLGLLASGSGIAVAQGFRSPWRAFTTADGLAADTVTAIHQTRDGALWFGSMQGLNRYDGAWETYTTTDGLAHNEITAIFQDQDGVLWVGTRGGLSRYEGGWLTPPDGLVGHDVSGIGQFEDGSLWFSTLDGGLSRLQGGRWDAYTEFEGLPCNCATAVAQGPRGDIWVGTHLGLAHYNGRTWRTYTMADGLADNMVTDILVAGDGTMWVGTLRGLTRLIPSEDDPSGNSWQTFLTEDGLAGEHITALMQDSEDLLVVATTTGVSVGDGQRWNTWTQRDGLASSEVRAVFQDSDGGLWFGTIAGVSHCDLTWRTLFLPQEGQADSTVSYDVSALVQTESGALWIATLGGGAVRHWDGHWETYTTDEGLADDNVHALAEDAEGAIWFGTAGGVSRYSAGGWKTYTMDAGLPADVILSVETASDGAMWFGTAGGGVVRYGPDNDWRTFAQEDGLGDDFVRAICEDQGGALWLGTSKGVNRFDGRSWQLFTSESTEGGLPGDEVRHVWCAADGSQWFATDQGAASYDGRSWQSYDRADGLPTNSVTTIWKDGEDVWIGTSGGLWRYDGRTWQVYTPQHGLPSSHVLSMIRSAPNTWWIGTAGGGLARYRPRRTPPWVGVVGINDRPLLMTTLTVPAEERNVAISFTGGSIHSASELLLYMYRLEGVSDDWTQGRDRFALYHDLSPGTYTFWLAARDLNLNYSEPYSVSITIGASADELTTGPAPATAQPSQVLNLSPTASATPAGGPVVALRPSTPVPAASQPASQRSTPDEGLPWRYGLLSLPLLAVVGMGYWGYGQWRARKAIRRDFNPYICGPPVYDEGMFFGRENMVREVLQIVHNNNVIIYGERRIGKTTLLYQLGQRLKKLEDPDYAFFPAFVNLQGIPQDRLFLLLAQGVAQDLEEKIGSLALICRSGGRGRASSSAPGLDWRPVKTGYSNLDFQEDLAAIVEALQRTTTKDARLILLLDEADVISTHDQIVQEQLRGVLMSSAARKVKVVLAGTYISKEWHLQSSPWYNLFSREIMLPPLDEGGIRRLIEQPVQGVYHYDNEAIRRIIVYSDRKPFEAQKLCLHAVKEVVEQGKRHVSASEVQAALKSSLEERASEFGLLWESMSADGRRALHVLARSMSAVAPGQQQGVRREKTLPRLPLSDGDRELLVRGGVLYRYDKEEHLLSPFQEWIRGESL